MLWRFFLALVFVGSSVAGKDVEPGPEADGEYVCVQDGYYDEKMCKGKITFSINAFHFMGYMAHVAGSNNRYSTHDNNSFLNISYSDNHVSCSMTCTKKK